MILDTSGLPSSGQAAAGPVLQALPAGHASSRFASEVLSGLSRLRKSIPPTWFYDARGAALFEAITNLPEYYLTRAELAVLRNCAHEVAHHAGQDVTVIELGSGSSRKTPLLLRALLHPRAYVPIDIAPESLRDAFAMLASKLPGIYCHPVVADFTREIVLPARLVARIAGSRRLGFFPGSTIGNLTPQYAVALLKRLGDLLKQDGLLLIGTDVNQDAETLLPAYDDAHGLTAAFNLNLLERINRELGGNFELAGFGHEVRWDSDLHRIEMHLVAEHPQSAELFGQRFTFRAYESIHTENAYKYPPDEFYALALLAGWTPVDAWFDQTRRFAVHLLARLDAAEGR